MAAERLDPPLRFDGRLVDVDGVSVAWPRLAVIGHPVSHSLSPRLHAAALRARRAEGVYRAVDVQPAHLAEFLLAAHAASLRGCNVTLPHKERALALVARATEEAEGIGATNTLVHRPEGWQAHNTDARGFALALSRRVGRALPRVVRRVVVLGSGGAARAVLCALEAVGAARVVVMARTPERATWAVLRGARVEPWNEEAPALRDASLVVQTTPIGLRPDDAAPVSAEHLPSDAVAVDLCYAPGGRRSAFLREAAARGCQVDDGLPMLIAQAALAFTLWLPGDVPLEPMASAVGLRW